MEFRKIDDNNFEECLKLSVCDEQKSFVADNIMSLAQAYLAVSNQYCVPMPFAIYNQDEMIGFIMMAYHSKPEIKKSDELFDEDIYEVWRLMIDKKYQQNGYGKQAMKKAIEFVKTYPYGITKKLILSYELHNTVAKHLYTSLGFEETGEVLDGEMISVLQL
jgi:diamine N-acetyltransferase